MEEKTFETADAASVESVSSNKSVMKRVKPLLIITGVVGGIVLTVAGIMVAKEARKEADLARDVLVSILNEKCSDVDE